MIDRLRHWLQRRQLPGRFAQLDALLRTQAMSREAVLAKQRADLRAIVADAVRDTDYYRDRYAGLDLDGDFDLRDLPILTKQEVTAHRDAMLARDADRSAVKLGHTGGSTGTPLAFWYDAAKHELMRAGMMRSYMMSGWRPGMKILNFWGAARDARAGGVFGGRSFVAAERTVSAREYTEQQLHDWAREIQAWRPALLQGYASILAELARYVIDNGMVMPRSLIGVYSTAEVLDAQQRADMERAFGCKVFNQYGSREVPNIACECRHGNMHVFTDMVYLESLGMDGEDRLLVTSLTNRLMPFIRYDIGDSGRLKPGECACGSPFPMMEMGLCRQNDLIRTPSGKHVHPSVFHHLLDGFDQVRQFQFVQEAPTRIVLNLVAEGELSAEQAAAARDRLRRGVDARMELDLNYVAEIPRTDSGKHRFVICRLGTR